MLYQESDRTPGGTAAALRQEALTGEQTAFSFHEIKALGVKNGLTKLLRSGNLTDSADIETARSTLQDVSSALDAWDEAALNGRFNGAIARGEISPARVEAAKARALTNDLSPFDNPADPSAYIGPETPWGAPDPHVAGAGVGGTGSDSPVIEPDALS
jgi:hypothetical protein